jgi:hypothetical protein
MSPHCLYYHEPCSPHRIRGGFDDWFRYLAPGSRDPGCLEPTLDRVFGRLVCPGWRWQHPLRTRLLPGYRVVVKEVAAAMSVEWIASRYQPKVVIVLRHPCPVILSVLALGTSPEAEVAALLRQTKLFRDHLELWRRTIEQASTAFEKIAVVWAARHRVIANAITRNPGWLRVFYEQLCLNAKGVFRGVFEHLGLVWTREVEDYVAYSSSNNLPGAFETVRISSVQPDAWKTKFTAREARSVRQMVERFDLPFYTSDEHWIR